jgi:hypothetical protein
MEKILGFKDKIDIILTIRKLNLKKVEKILDVDGTFYKAYNENREPREELMTEFLRKFHVKLSWWVNPKGTTEADVFDKNGTYVEIPTKEKDPDELIRILVNNIDRMGRLNDWLLQRVKDLEQGRT